MASPDINNIEFSASACQDSPSLISLYDENRKLIELSNIPQLHDTDGSEDSAHFETYYTNRAANNKTEEFLMKKKEMKEYNMKQRLLIKDEYIATHFPDIAIPNTKSLVMTNTMRKITKNTMFGSEVDQNNGTEKDEVFVVCDIPNIQGIQPIGSKSKEFKPKSPKPTRRLKKNEGNQYLVPLKAGESVLPDFTDFTMKEIKEEDAILHNDMIKLTITEVEKKDALMPKNYITVNDHGKIILLSQNGSMLHA